MTDSSQKLEELLSILSDDLKDLDRTGLVRDICANSVKETNNEIYTGTYDRIVTTEHNSRSIAIKVAIKRMKDYMWSERVYARYA